MSKKQVTIIAKIKAKDGMREQLKEVLLSLIEPTRAEEGCITYSLHQDCDDPSVFMFYENWASKEALDIHLQTPHLQGLVARADELFAAPLEIKFYEMLA
ncbi:MAG: antibiotic biosynthesis monooxygenase [Deltaproteobacteria bacterium]|nr:antibiotic biosynthesis monooxygenase [Deltaproteobacteria bacterium]